MAKPLLALLGLFILIAGGCGKKMSEEQLFTAAQQFEAKEDMDGALKIYEEMSARFPNSPHADSVLQKSGMIYLNKKAQFDKAVASYERLVEKFPQSKYLQGFRLSQGVLRSIYRAISAARIGGLRAMGIGAPRQRY